MRNFLYLLSFSLVASAIPNAASAQTVSLDPGLYEYSHVLNVGGQDMGAEDLKYCVREGENTKSLDELVERLSGGGQCKLTNVSMTNSTGSADIICTETDLGFDINGKLDAKFGSDFYDVDTTTALGPLKVILKSKVRRAGDCPVSWKNPDEVSAG